MITMNCSINNLISMFELQLEVNCYNTNKKLVEFAKSKGLVVVAFSPLGTPSKG